MVAANRQPITIVGAMFVTLAGVGDNKAARETHVMVYISPDAQGFYMSKQAMVSLGIIPPSFPKVGAVDEASGVKDQEKQEEEVTSSQESHQAQSPEPPCPCSCPTRTAPPPRPTELPFECKPENVGKIKAWLLDRYKSSTFNKCTHQTPFM